ncbi:MAG: hypothetical protein JOY54_15120 [Acidobacteriaceae bacterium]|nr:hypothetical protein [Acidobacteriaceae bacterium]
MSFETPLIGALLVLLFNSTYRLGVRRGSSRMLKAMREADQSALNPESSPGRSDKSESSARERALKYGLWCTAVLLALVVVDLYTRAVPVKKPTIHPSRVIAGPKHRVFPVDVRLTDV